LIFANHLVIHHFIAMYSLNQFKVCHCPSSARLIK
jgi:hypothetical protein